jgi:hypothetical protein
MPEAVQSAIPEEEGGTPDAAPAAAAEMELEPEAVEMELEARDASEAVGVATEDSSQRPQSDDELVSAAESAPEIVAEPIAPEAATTIDEVSETAPAEEKEEAELITHMSPDSPPEARSDALPPEPKERELDKRLNREDPDPGAAPGESVAEVEAEEVPLAEGAEALGGETLEPDDAGDEESIESIVQDLKRARKQD